MSQERLYRRRLARYVTAMRNETPDRGPIRPFVAEFTATYAGMTCQDVWERVDLLGNDYIWQMLLSF